MNAMAENILAALDSQTILLIGLALVIGSLLWHNAWRRSRRRVEGRTSSHAVRHNTRLGVQAQEDIELLMVRLDELSREICGQIDTRFAKLEHVLAEADEKLAALESAMDRSATAEANQPASPPADPRHAEVCLRDGQGAPAVQIAHEMGMTVGEVELILSLERSRQSVVGESPLPAEGAGPAAAVEPHATGGVKKAPTARRKGAGLDERA